jgi:FO synthase
MLHGRVDHVQVSWVKLGTAGARTMLRAGADDLGGTLMEETISRMAGSEHGSWRTPADLDAVAAGIGRPTRVRTTTYGCPPDERVALARSIHSYDEALRGETEASLDAADIDPREDTA